MGAFRPLSPGMRMGSVGDIDTESVKMSINEFVQNMMEMQRERVRTGLRASKNWFESG